MRIVILAYLAAINLLAFSAFGWDKWRARRGGRRVPESTLLVLALPFGVAGAWAGVRVFRHKTRKASFRWKLALVTAADALFVALALYLSDAARFGEAGT